MFSWENTEEYTLFFCTCFLLFLCFASSAKKNNFLKRQWYIMVFNQEVIYNLNFMILISDEKLVCFQFFCRGLDITKWNYIQWSFKITGSSACLPVTADQVAFPAINTFTILCGCCFSLHDFSSTHTKKKKHQTTKTKQKNHVWWEGTCQIVYEKLRWRDR